jgi:hypothetical protein
MAGKTSGFRTFVKAIVSLVLPVTVEWDEDAAYRLRAIPGGVTGSSSRKGVGEMFHAD